MGEPKSEEMGAEWKLMGRRNKAEMFILINQSKSYNLCEGGKTQQKYCRRELPPRLYIFSFIVFEKLVKSSFKAGGHTGSDLNSIKQNIKNDSMIESLFIE